MVLKKSFHEEEKLFKAIIEFIKSLWQIMNSPNNDPVVVGLLIAVVALIISHVMNSMSFRARLKDKDKTIEDLVEQRNKFQDLLLQSKGLTRKSSRK
jgi:hypothetical protein